VKKGGVGLSKKAISSSALAKSVSFQWMKKLPKREEAFSLKNQKC